MKGLQRLSEIRNLSIKNKTWSHTNLFRILKYEDLWITAYENLKSNKGSLTPGSTPETMDAMSVQRLQYLQTKVLEEKFNFNPVKRTYIPRPDGRKRPLGMPTANDKIVQEVLRMILEAVYEPIFSIHSFGFRPDLGCHDALEHIETKFRWVNFVIEGDIEQAYPSINYDVLINKCLRRRVSDERFINLVWKLLKCGILEDGQYFKTTSGIPQGSIVGPILANIYYNELDEWVELKIKQLNQPRSNRRNPAYKKIEHSIRSHTKRLEHLSKTSKEYKDLVKEIKNLRLKRLNIPSLADQKIQIEYVRYADDWMIGVSGDENLALQLKSEVKEFITNELKQTMNHSKTFVTNLRKGKVKFLGYEIFIPDSRPLHKYKGLKHTTQTIRRGNRKLRFDLPQDLVVNRLKEKGYVRIINNRTRSISRSGYTCLEDHVIVSHFRSLYLGIAAYYSGITKRQRIQYIHYLLKMSCAMTLGHKHRKSCAKIFKQYGKTIQVPLPNKGGSVNYPNITSWSLSDKHWKKGKKFGNPFSKYSNRVSRSSLGQSCLVCNSIVKVEMHHVKHIKKQGERYGGFRKEMSLLNRKQVPLCRECYMKVHHGLYDGMSLKDLQQLAIKNLLVP